MTTGTMSWSHRVRSLFSPLRGRTWRRWVGVVLAFNIALGMGFSVVLLRHQVDARSRTGTLLAQLDAAVWAQDAQFERARRDAGPAGTTALEAAAGRVQVTAGSVTAALRAEGEGTGGLARAVTAHDRAADQVVSALAAGDDDALTGALADLATSGQAVHRAVADATARHDDSTTSAGRVADFETLFMMVFAAAMAGLLFRRFEAARRSGELRVAEAKARSEARFRALVHRSSDVITLADAGLVIGFQTPSVSRLLGRTAEELAGTVLTDLVHPEDRIALLDAQDDAVREPGTDTVSEVRLRHADGTWRHVHSVHTNLLADPDVHAVVITTRDVTAQKRLEAQLQYSAFHDALTGLANRALFTDRLEHALARTDRVAESLAVLFVDLDDFKGVNDGAGHGAGDALLVAVAERLREALRPGDTIARLGGDEFAVLLEDATTGDAELAAERLLAALGEPFRPAGGSGDAPLRVGASVGIAVGAASQHDAAELLRHADVAMYAAKEAGKGRAAVFAPDMDSAIIGQLRLKAELIRALEEGEFTVHYQPSVELASGRLAGVEALVRWQHPERGLVPPADFIPVAEQTGLIVPLGRFVLRQALRQMRAWHENYPTHPPVTVSVNLSARELDEPGLVASVREALAESGLDPRYVILEITESLLMVDLPRTVATLAELRALGVRLAVDDFGTGYSSLAYLENLPVDILKIDKSFVDRIGEPAVETEDDGGERPGPVMVSAICQLGHALHLQLVAEGIEQPDQVTTLRGLDCHHGQGYYFARPLPVDDLADLLRRQATEPGWNLHPRSDAMAPAR